MHDGDIDYSRYTLLELEEALAGINRHKYPRNFAKLALAYERLAPAHAAAAVRAAMQAPAPTSTEEAEDPEPQPQYDACGRYIPNQIPVGERAIHVALSLVLLAYGGLGVWINDLYIPGKRKGLHLHDVPAWIMYGAIICACLVMLSVVIDHYDRRNNERHYREFAKASGYIGWTLFGFSALWAIVAS